MASLPVPTFTSGVAFVHLPGVGSSPVQPGTVFGKLRLSTDPIGTTTVTFAGINANSEIRVYLPDGTEAAGIENCATNQVLTWQVYSAGSPNNTVTIRIINWLYDIKELTYTSTVGNTSLPIQQKRDKWSLNPA
jgi:hypothetical protein